MNSNVELNRDLPSQKEEINEEEEHFDDYKDDHSQKDDKLLHTINEEISQSNFELPS